MIEFTAVSKSFRRVEVLKNIDLHIGRGERVALVGSNGAGKTTIFNIINALYRPDRGRVLLEGENLVSLKPHQIAKRGIARTFQNIELFNEMTVLENILKSLFQFAIQS